MLHKIQRDSHFLERILFTDECSLSNSNILNPQNARIWAYRNPHAMVQWFNQGRFVINVWAGIIGNNIVGPIYLPSRLTSSAYVRYLKCVEYDEIIKKFDFEKVGQGQF